MAACPICNREVAPRAENTFFPFCTSRCKTVDLGKWLNEEYRVPGESDGEEGNEEQPPPPPERDMRH